MHIDPKEQPSWAMRLIVHIDKHDPPTRTAVCQAAATAVVQLLTDNRTRPGGEWFGQVRRWTDGRIRKHCRPARRVAWGRVQTLPGVTALVAGAEVRALVPTSTEQIPREVIVEHRRDPRCPTHHGPARHPGSLRSESASR